MCDFEMYDLHPATDLLLEELALTSVESETVRDSNSGNTADGEVTTN